MTAKVAAPEPQFRPQTILMKRMMTMARMLLDHGTDHIDDNGDEEYENGKEDPGESGPHAASSGQRLSRGDVCFRKRTRVPWLESDDLRSLAYGKNMDMEWKDIFELFPDRTPGAVWTLWHMLRENDPSSSTQTPASSADSDIIQKIDPLLLRDTD
ncbi:hypothetical protein K505DRAFT_368487 [Melanomma pulvis-pyrius CBS 109.77]|uniref:Myb-like domain-containing protein n=1 Tax=Melanomma pulvis-pyrius CBS 109.77 TaxID=1314802 RepID=A0A6A6WPU8_9PLEO|nr:hypothetical protein K505DRAFT_368487 [Melanomma pulvis-pyrius CBS 109.77]